MAQLTEARDIDVHVTRTSSGFTIDPSENGLNLKDNDLICSKTNMHKDGCHLLMFHLSGDASLMFPADPQAAFWAEEQPDPKVRKGPKKPRKLDDCVPTWVSSDRRVLALINFDKRAKRIAYTLRLVDQTGSEYLCDPIMSNGGGGSPFVESNLAGAGLLVAGAVLAGAALISSAIFFGRERD